jgi:Predicted permeases
MACRRAGVGGGIGTIDDLWLTALDSPSAGHQLCDLRLTAQKINLPAVPGLFVETCTLLPVALIYLWQFADSPSANLFDNPINLNMLLAAAGLITTIPLLCFTGAATRLPLTVLGFFQYIGPSLMFLLAVGLYDEPFTPDKATTFAFIWAALAIFSVDAYQNKRHQVTNIKRAALSTGKPE